MAHKIKKTDLLIEIRGKGAICRTYQEENPDKLAQQRVSKLDNNPCGDGKYYVNVLLKDGLSLSYTDPETIKKLGYDLTEEDILKVYDEFLRVATRKQVGVKELDAIVASVALQVPPTYVLKNYVINNVKRV